jgi:hypothetical protein
LTAVTVVSAQGVVRRVAVSFASWFYSALHAEVFTQIDATYSLIGDNFFWFATR